VLPFTYESDSPDAALIADALTDQLIATLGEIDSLQVTAPASVAGFTRSTPRPSEIAAALGVDVVLRPKVTFPGPGPARERPRSVRVDADLIVADTEKIVWSRGFTGEFSAMRSLHAAIARQVAQAIRAEMTPAASRRLARGHTTTQGTTEAYFEGLHHLKQLTPEHARLAIAAFERAIDLDPQFAPALAGLARSYVDLGFMGAITHAEARALAAVRIERALELDGDSSEVRAVNADLKFYYDWDWRGADAEYQRAIALNASSDRALFQYARYLAAAGQLDSAIDYAGRARSVNPLSSRAASTVALLHLFRRDYASALSAVDEATRLDPNSANPYIVRSRILAASGAIDEAIAAARAALSLSGHPPPGWRAHLISLKARAGHRDEALAEMRQLVADLERKRERMGPEHLAYIHLGLNDSQTALDFLERAADERSPDMLWFAVDPRVDPLRGNPRFERVLERLAGR
jgi:serine/threonine-protein kinase